MTRAAPEGKRAKRVLLLAGRRGRREPAVPVHEVQRVVVPRDGGRRRRGGVRSERHGRRVRGVDSHAGGDWCTRSRRRPRGGAWAAGPGG